MHSEHTIQTKDLSLADALGDATKLELFVAAYNFKSQADRDFICKLLGIWSGLDSLEDALEKDLKDFGPKTDKFTYIDGHRNQKIEMISRIRDGKTNMLRTIEKKIVAAVENS